MIEGLFNDPNYAASKKLLDATALRHEAIARNLANLQTPNYKRVDVAPSFQTELRQALAGKDATAVAAVRPQLQADPNATAANGDGNTVQLETELMALSKNSLEHSFETQLVTGRLLRLRLAITGRSI